MILGIIAAAFSCVFYISIPCGVVGLVLSLLGKKKSKAANAPTGAATAGMVLSIIGVVLGLIVGLIFGGAIIAAITGAKQIQQQMDANMRNLLDWVRIF